MDSDEFSDDGGATGERRYRPNARSAKGSILKNSTSQLSYAKRNVLNSDDDDNYTNNGSARQNSYRNSNGRYDSPINSYRSDEVTANKPPSGRLQPINSSGRDRSKMLGSENRLGSSTYPGSRNTSSTVPSITFNNNGKSGIGRMHNDSDDSITENFSSSNRFNKNNRFGSSSDSKHDKYDTPFSSKYDKTDLPTTSKYDKYDTPIISKHDRFDNKYDMPSHSKHSDSKYKDDTRYDTYDEDDRKETSKYYRSEGPLKSLAYVATALSGSNTKLDTEPIDDIYRSNSAREPRSVRSNSLDRLNKTDTLYNDKNISLNAPGSRFNKFNSTSNINNMDTFDRSHTANSLNSTTLSVREAKSRSFLVGSLSSINGKGLLSAEELDRTFSDRRARILVATWNMGGIKSLPKSLDDLLLPETIQTLPDVYIIGAQEIELNQKQWEIKLQEQIGPSHVKLNSHFHGSIGISIFVKRDLIWYCSIAEFEHINLRGTGPINSPVKTKASVVVSFQLFGTLMCFICSHFSAGEGNLNQRIENYNTTVSNITLPIKLQNKFKALSTDHTENFDCVFWFGDLNFLNTKERDKVERKVLDVKYRNSINFEDVINHDELYQVIYQEKAFKHFLEGRITFEPTYKFDVGSDSYDTSEKCRIPSYTDRILYRSRTRGTISCSVYDSIKQIRLSDHRPVYGLYEVTIRPGADKIPLSYGDFDRQIYEAGYKRRQMYRACNIGFEPKQGSKPCTII